MKKISIRQVLSFVIGILGLSFFASLQMKINIGIAPWDALGRSLSYITNFKVGDIAIIQSLFCVIVSAILAKKVTIRHILTFLVGFFIGSMINFFFYTIFADLQLESYAFNLVLFTLCVVASATSVSLVHASHITSLPLETLCGNIADRINQDFGVVRTVVDVFCVIVIVILTVIFSIEITLREGSIISTLLFGPVMGVLVPRLTKWLHGDAKPSV